MCNIKNLRFLPSHSWLQSIFFCESSVFCESSLLRTNHVTRRRVEKKPPQYPTKGHAPHNPLFIFPCRPPQGTTGPDDDEGKGIYFHNNTNAIVVFSRGNHTPRNARIHNLATRTLGHTHRVDTRFVDLERLVRHVFYSHSCKKKHRDTR